MYDNGNYVFCEACNGMGHWEAECCNGSGGCSCQGQPVNMGVCNVCGGTGKRHIDADRMANVKDLKGCCFIGSGPTTGYWATKGKRLNRI